MRRGVSITVLLSIVCLLLAPLAQASASQVPACCRAEGKHHCMAMGQSGPDGFRSQPGRCPCCVATVATNSVAVPVIANSDGSLLSSEPETAIAVTQLALRVAFGDLQKRGPPIA